MLAYFEMLRPANCAMAALAVFIGAMLVNPHITIYLPLIYAILAVMLITGAGNMINDCGDVEIDKVNRPNRPLPSKRAKKEIALWLSLILFFAGLLLSYKINMFCFALAAINTLFLITYTFIFKHKWLVGSVITSYMVGSTFLYGALVFPAADLSLPLILMFMALLVNLARELVKKNEDETGDRLYVLKKVLSSFIKPMRFGEKENRHVAVTSLGTAIVLSLFPYFTKTLSISYLAMVTVADVIFFYCLLKLFSSKRTASELKIISKLIKIGMLVALLAFIAGVYA